MEAGTGRENGDYGLDSGYVSVTFKDVAGS